MTPRDRYKRVDLPSGLAKAGGGERLRVSVRSLTGDEEWMLADRGGPTQASLATALIDACARGLPGEGSAALTTGDREALLLAVRRATFGDRI